MRNYYVLKDVNIIDCVSDDILYHKSIEIKDGIITLISDEIKADSKDIIDLGGAFVTPGLINLHGHLPASGKVGKKKVASLKGLVKFMTSTALTRRIGMGLEKKYAKMELCSGVTTFRSVGGIGNLDTMLRNKNYKDVPRIIASNYAIGVNGGHMDGTVAKAISSEDEARGLVKELVNDNVDLIKIMITGGVLDASENGSPAKLRMELPLVKAVCDEAHQNGLKVAAHVESPEGVEVAILGGVNTIEHGSNITEELVEVMKEHKSSQVITLSAGLPFIKLDPSETGYGEIGKKNSTIVIDGMIDMAKKMLDSGLLVGLGNDAGSPFVTHYNFYKELVFYQNYLNVSAYFALKSATITNAKIVGLDSLIGSIEVGKCADLIVLKDNPLEDLNRLSDNLMVIARGNIIKKKNEKYIDIEEKLKKVC